MSSQVIEIATSDAQNEPRDGQLFVAVARGGPAAKDAQAALYARHVRYLNGALQRQRDRLLRLAGLSVEDVVHDTFERAFARAASFEDDATLDPDRARRRARAWLGRIAQNLIADAFRRHRELSASPLLDEVAGPPDGPPSSRPDLEPILRALAQLTDREQDILRVSALYFKAEGHGRLPNEISAELGARWGISNDNVRAIRKRALEKLRRLVTAPMEDDS
jgi:RNA polymerase sigma factor (sigma-70 family)